jgi:L-2-hydroxyglutarate oxidase
MRTADVVVIGGGIVGLATARELATAHRLRVVVVEREPRVACHQTGHNSGVVHSGLYYRPESHKAATCVEGRESLFRYAAERRIPHERCGKVVVAVEAAELPRLEELERRGRANGLAGLERLDAAGIREREPHAAGLAGLHVPETGIVDFRAVAESFAADLRAAGGEVRTGAPVTAIEAGAGRVALGAGGERLEAGFLVACAGFESDRVARLAGLDPGVRIVPFRGDYCELAGEAKRLVRHLIYPVPDPELPFLGVHLTRRVDGAIEAGPNAVLAWRRDGYAPGAFSLRDAAATLCFSGFWRMGRRLLRTGAGEYARAWSRGRFLDALRRLLPALSESDLAPAGCGIRAQAVDRAGRLVDDFVFAEGERMLHVVNAPSPAATASMALARRIAERASARLDRAA